MILVFQIICLLVTLFVLQQYITLGVSSHMHRLLPLVLGLIGVYNFYNIIEYLTQERILFNKMTYLLLMQVLYLLLFYMLDFLQLKIPDFVADILFTSLVAINLVLIIGFDKRDVYGFVYVIFVTIYIVIILGLGTYAYVHYTYSEREHAVTNMLYVALLVPAVAIALHLLFAYGQDGVLVSGGLACSCLIFWNLMKTDQLIDTKTILQENLFDTTDLAIVLFDADYYYIEANAAAKRIFPEQLDIPAKKRKAGKYIGMVRNIPKGRENRQEVEVDGRHLEYQILPVYYHEKLRGHVLYLVDITKQKKETQLMAGLKLAAENQTQEKSRFLARMGHDLRSPLHAIIGISNILEGKQEISARNRALVLHIRRAGNTLLELVNAILDYSKLEAGHLELVQRKYTMESILEELARECLINLQSKPVELSVLILNEHPSELFGDDMRVREMIQNILSNAVKFTESGSIRCEVSCRMEGKRALFTCSVTDSGPGMSQEKIDRIFDEYISYADSKVLEGAGLGLCIVRQLAELMGGEVLAQSDGVHGSTVQVSFYQDVASDTLNPPIAYTKRLLMRQSAMWNHAIRPEWVFPEAKVLIADDMKINQEIFKELALPWQFELVVVQDGNAAVEAARKQEFQMIFLDQMMPGMTGVEAAREIAAFSKAPLVLVSADFSDDSKQTYAQAGFADFLAKPIRMSAFQKIVEKHMPKEYRRLPEREMEKMAPGYRSSMRAYRRTLETFVNEMSPLISQLETYAREDLNQFRVKVHGIKGASRQLGRYELSELAEALEMAAKLENRSYMERHLERFLQEMQETIEEVKQELAQIPVEPASSDETDAGKLFAKLKEGFDHYDMSKIEDSLDALRQMPLGEQEREILMKAEMACDDFEYERGSELLETFISEISCNS